MAIGQKLEDARNRKGISIREASESTKIRGDFLTSFESGNFDINLPEVYLRGFIRVYARFLGIDPDSAVSDLNLEIGTGKSKSKKTIGKIGNSEPSDSSSEMVVAEPSRNVGPSYSKVNHSNRYILLSAIAGSCTILLVIFLIWIFSSPEGNQNISSNLPDEKKLSIRETVSENSNESSKANSVEVADNSMLRLAAVGEIERLIISDEGKSPKVFHEFKNLSRGWEQTIPFTQSFRCYSSALQHIRFAVDDGIEKQVSGEGAGNFSWPGK